MINDKQKKRLKIAAFISAPFAAAGLFTAANLKRNLRVTTDQIALGSIGLDLTKVYFPLRVWINNLTWFDFEKVDMIAGIYSGERFKLVDIESPIIELPKEQKTEFELTVEIPYRNILRYFGNAITDKSLLKTRGLFLFGSVRVKIKQLPFSLTIPVFQRLEIL